MRIIAIGPIHGCLDEYLSLLTLLTIEPHKDVVIHIGNIIGLGPNSNDLISYIKLTSNWYPIINICGTFERNLIRYAEKDKTNSKVTNEPLAAKFYRDLRISEQNLQYLKKSQLYYRRPNLLFIHGGVPESMDKLPLDSSFAATDQHSNLLRCDYVDESGEYVQTNKRNKETSKYWATNYDGRFGLAITGHKEFMSPKPKLYDHNMAINLGCVSGGHLCALVLEQQPDATYLIDYITVPAKKQYVLP